MHHFPRERRFRVQVVSRSALIRLAVLLGALLILGSWAWATLFWMPGRSYQGQLPPLQKEQVTLQNFLREDIQKIAVEIGARNLSFYENLNAGKTFLNSTLSEIGYQVKQQEFKVANKSYHNLEVEKTGTEKPDEIIVVGGHYDSAFNSPGANDNGTGTAATLELARIFANQ